MIKQHTTRNQLSFVNALVTMGAVLLILVWGVTSLTNGDVLWFVHRFTARADTLTIDWDGKTYSLHAGDPGYEAVMDAFAKAIASPGGYEPKVGFSEQGITNYRTRFRLLEVHFAQPVQLHTRYPFPEVTTFLVPLNETHGYAHRVFPFTGRLPYTSGPVNLSKDNFDALYAAVDAAVQATAPGSPGA